MTTLMTSSNDSWAYNMLISGFVLGTVIFVLFLWQAIQNYMSVLQIRKFKEKTDNIYQDKTAWAVIRSFELVICLLWIAELVLFIVAEVFKSKYYGNEDTRSKAVNTAAAHNIVFLVDAVLIICYMAIAYFWNGSIIVVFDQGNLITTIAVCPQKNITVSRTIGSKKQLFKITYKDPDLRGNLKDFKLRYTRKLEAFLIKNHCYEGDE